VHCAQCSECIARHMHNAQATTGCELCKAQSARCALCKCCAFTVSSVFLGPVGFVRKLCTIPNQCAMCVQPARCAMLSVLGVLCANVVRSLCAVCFCALSVPWLPCAHAAYSAPSLCNVCVACKCAMLNVLGVLCANRARFAVCSVFLGPGYSVHMLCTIPHHCAMCMYLIRCAMLSVYLVRCDKSLPSANCCSAPMPEPTPLPLVCSACCA
jgi:hypothetical protein